MPVDERRHERKPEGAQASLRMLEPVLVERGVTYDEFVWSLEDRVGAAC